MRSRTVNDLERLSLTFEVLLRLLVTVEAEPTDELDRDFRLVL